MGEAEPWTEAGIERVRRKLRSLWRAQGLAADTELKLCRGCLHDRAADSDLLFHGVIRGKPVHKTMRDRAARLLDHVSRIYLARRPAPTSLDGFYRTTLHRSEAYSGHTASVVPTLQRFDFHFANFDRSSAVLQGDRPFIEHSVS